LDEARACFDNHLKSTSPLTYELAREQHPHAYPQYGLIKKIDPRQHLCSDTRIFLNPETWQGNGGFFLHENNILTMLQRQNIVDSEQNGILKVYFIQQKEKI
jgi:hypothetical protein